MKMPVSDAGKTGVAAIQDAAPAVFLENVVFYWPGQRQPTLDIPSLTVRRGEHVFISGPSGSGKSTLLSLIAGILSPRSGQVFVSGVCLSGLDSAQRDVFRGEHIGFIFQQFNLIPYLSILENVLIPCRLSPLRSHRAHDAAGSPAAEAKTLLERLDLAPSLWERPVSRLSMGQQQRTAAARALIGRPSLVIADEPTSALDADRQKSFLRLLLEQCGDVGASLLFVSHDQRLADAFQTVLCLPELNRAREKEAR